MPESPLNRLRQFHEKCRQKLARTRSDAARKRLLSEHHEQYEALLAGIAQSGPLGAAFVDAHNELTFLGQIQACGRKAGGWNRIIQGLHVTLGGVAGKPPRPGRRLSLLAALEHLEALRTWLDGALAAEPAGPRRRRQWTQEAAEPKVRAFLAWAQDHQQTFSVRAVAKATGIPPSTVHRTTAWENLGSDARRHITYRTDWAADAAEECPGDS